MFRGLTSINLDTKGRMAIPSRYRSLLENKSSPNWVMTIDTEDPCLLMYPLSQWQSIEHKLAALPSFQPKTRRIQRLLIGHATELSMDKQGRLLIPPLLRAYAQLDKSILLVGQGGKFEIWSDSQWQVGREAWLKEAYSAEDGLPDELTTLSL